TEMTAPPAAPGTTRAAISRLIEGALPATREETAKASVDQRNTFEVPMASMNVPVMAVATAEASRKEVMAQGRRVTSPSSAATSGRAAVIARPSKATIATVVKMAIEAGSSWGERMERGTAMEA